MSDDFFGKLIDIGPRVSAPSVNRPAPSRTRAHLDGTSTKLKVPLPERSEGSERSESSEVERGCPRPTTRPKRSGTPSASAVAGALLREPLLRGEAPLRFFSVSLTTRAGDRAELALKANQYLAIVERRLTTGGALLAHDVKNGRSHLHALVAVPPRFEERKLSAWWLRLWPRGDAGPLSICQRVRPMEIRREEFFKVLVHHLRGPHRADEKAMQPMAGRVLVAGVFSAPWLHLLPWVRGDVATKPPPLPVAVPRSPKVSAKPFPRLAEPAKACAWCGLTFRVGARSDCKFHNGCRQSAARGLKQAVALNGTRVRDWVQDFDVWHLLRPDAMKLAARVLSEAPWLTPGNLPHRLAQRLFPRCHCGRPLAFRPDAKTCGRSFCRLKRPRSEVVELDVARQLQRLRQQLYRPQLAPEPDTCTCREPEVVESGRHSYCALCLLKFDRHPREVTS